jgi:ankyrin repeat protein
MPRRPDDASALFDAIAAGDLAGVKQFVTGAPDFVACTAKSDRLIESIPHWLYTGDTPLHLAAAALRDDIVEFLLNRRADPRTVNRRGASALHYVCDPRPRSGGVWDPLRQVRTIEHLIGAGADMNLPDHGGATPLHRAVRARGVAAVQALLRNGASVSVALRTSGSTPLHLAVTGSGASGTSDTGREQLEIIHALLASGADPRGADSRGRSAEAAARSPEIKRALLRL